jgi:hypothetical protein
MAVALALVWATAGGAGAAGRPTAVEYISAYIGVANGQTAQLTAFNGGTRPSTERLALFDVHGTLLSAKRFTVDPGQGASLNFTMPAGESRAEIRAVVGPGTFIPGLEIYDNATMRTESLTFDFRKITVTIG